MDEVTTNFPDREFLEKLIRHLDGKTGANQQPLQRLLMLSGAAMNWIADYITDENAQWSKETVALEALYLTGTNPSWNAIIIERCERSPRKLRELFETEPQTRALFAEAKFENPPILARYEEGRYKVLDGMHRVIAALRDGHKTIEAFVARLEGKPRPHCEPHVVYDLLKAYHRKLTTDREGLLAALRFLRGSYANVDGLLRERFNKSWVPDDEIQEIIKEAL